MAMINPLNESPLAFPVLESLHILGFTCGVGMIALVNFRLLGFGLTRKSAGQLWRETLPWTLAGLTLAISAGLLLFSINPDVYYSNYTFLAKMAALCLAIVFYYTAVWWAAGTGSTRSWARVVGGVSLALWTLVVFGGIFIGLSATRPPAAAAPPPGVNFDDFLKGTAGK
jgi:hypothetical protein